MGIEDKIEEIRAAYRLMRNSRDELFQKDIRLSERRELDRTYYQQKLRIPFLFTQLEIQCSIKGIVVLVNGESKTYLAGEQVHVGENNKGEPYIKCLGIGYLLDGNGNISKVNLAPKGKFSLPEEWGYRLYSMLASPGVRDLILLANSPEVDDPFKQKVTNYLQKVELQR